MRILLIEDDCNLKMTLAFQLEKEGYTVDACGDGEDALYYMNSNTHDLILLDRMLPKTDGITLLKKFREGGSQTPVIILTALGDLGDKVTGLDAGADDYLVKPFEFEELLARIRSINRRPRQWNKEPSLCIKDIAYSSADNHLSGTLGSCSLSKKEGMLLEVFLLNPNQVLPRDTLLSRVWGVDAEVEDGNLDNYIHFIRRRLNCVSRQVCIQTVRGVGYRLASKDSEN